MAKSMDACKTWGWVTLLIGVGLLAQDLGWWTFGGLHWWTLAFLLWGACSLWGK